MLLRKDRRLQRHGFNWIHFRDTRASVISKMYSTESHRLRGAIIFFNCLNLYHTSPDSGARLYESTACKKRFDRARKADGQLQEAVVSAIDDLEVVRRDQPSAPSLPCPAHIYYHTYILIQPIMLNRRDNEEK